MTAKRIKEDEAEDAANRMSDECERHEIKIKLTPRIDKVYITLVKEIEDGN
jgi:hypothetical protein